MGGGKGGNKVNLSMVSNSLIFMIMNHSLANRVTDKLTPVHDSIFCCRSGSAADTQAVADIVKYYLELFGLVSEKNNLYSITRTNITMHAFINISFENIPSKINNNNFFLN